MFPDPATGANSFSRFRMWQAFESLASDSAGVFEVVGASREDVLTKVRLMALLGLGAQATTLSFEDVQVRRQSDRVCLDGTAVAVLHRLAAFTAAGAAVAACTLALLICSLDTGGKLICSPEL